MAAPLPDGAQELPADWGARLRRGLLAEPDHDLDHCYYGGLPAARLPPLVREQLRAELPERLQAAAVLVPIVQRPQAPTLLLTVRASNLRQHAGQISFPGGQLEPGDTDAVAAAVRETGEELGIAPGFIDPIGFLSDHIVRTGYRVTPVVALVQAGFALKLASVEVAEAFELPLAFALATANYRAQPYSLREIVLQVWELSYRDHTIWGATAGMLTHLCGIFGDQSASDADAADAADAAAGGAGAA